MKKELFALGCLLLAVAPTHAGDTFSEPTATAYWQLPLGASQTGKSHHAFGFSLDQTVRDNSGNLVSSFSAPLKPALVNLKLNGKGVEGLYMNGFNMASPIMLKALESGGGGWTILGSAALAAVGVAISSQRSRPAPENALATTSSVSAPTTSIEID